MARKTEKENTAEQTAPGTVDISLDPRNARLHGKASRETIHNSLEKCGAGRSILVDAKNVIIAGNGVFEEAQKIGLPVRIVESDGKELIAIRRTDLQTEDEVRKALALADNKTAEFAAWNDEVLQEMVHEFPTIDISTFGFDLKDFVPDGLSDGEMDEKDEKTEKQKCPKCGYEY